ncbi:hypothetical protein BDF22DRAFT_232851 [Syncephalis plumigaleata]|nr:hypothetical protein BDF22DRAFT_232851 [Syncephalis plumigaleata]
MNPFHYLALTLLSSLVANRIGADARLTIYRDDNTTLTYSTANYFLQENPNYNYSGYSIVWPWKDTHNCTMHDAGLTVEPLNRPKIISQMKQHENITITTSLSGFTEAGCESIFEVEKAAGVLSRQFTGLGLPPIKQIIVVDGEYNDVTELSDPWYSKFYISGLERVNNKLSTINAVLLCTRAAHNVTSVFNERYTYSFEFKRELGLQNELYLSKIFISYKRIYFGLVSIMLTYTCFRLIAMIILGTYPKDLRLATYAIAAIYAMCKLAINH